MDYRPWVVLGVLGLLYLVVDRLNLILNELRRIETSAGIVRMEVEGLAGKVDAIVDTLDDARSHLRELDSIANEYQGLVLRSRSGDPLDEF